MVLGPSSAAQVQWGLSHVKLFLSWIVQGPQLPSEPDISWTEKGLRVQERGNSPQDRILLSWEAEAESQLHRVLGLPSCSLLGKAGQPAQQLFPPVAQTLPSHAREWGVERALAFLRSGMHVGVTPGPSKALQTLNMKSELFLSSPQPWPTHNPPPYSTAAISSQAPLSGMAAPTTYYMPYSHNLQHTIPTPTPSPHSYPAPILSSPPPIPTLNSSPDPSQTTHHDHTHPSIFLL